MSATCQVNNSGYSLQTGIVYISAQANRGKAADFQGQL